MISIPREPCADYHLCRNSEQLSVDLFEPGGHLYHFGKEIRMIKNHKKVVRLAAIQRPRRGDFDLSRSSS